MLEDSKHASLHKPLDDLIRRLLGNLKQTGTAYIYIYLVENRLRTFAHDTLRDRYEDQYRDGWLHEVLGHVDANMIETLESRRFSHLKKNGYLSVDDDPIIAFLTISELKILVLRHWETFKIHFHDKTQFNAVFDVIEVARNSAAHNRAVSAELVKDLREQCLRLINMMGGLGSLDSALRGPVELDIVEELFSSRYRDVIGVFSSRSDFQSKISYDEYFAQAQSVDAIGLSLNAITLNYGSENLVRQVRDRGASLRLLFLDPEGQAIKDREQEECLPTGTLSSLTRTNIAIVQRALKMLPDDRARELLQYRTYNSAIRLNLYIIDKNISVAQHYSPGGAGVESPCLLLKNKNMEYGLFDHYQSTFEEMWKINPAIDSIPAPSKAPTSSRFGMFGRLKRG